MKLEPFCLRPIKAQDLESCYQLALQSQAGLTNLPKDRKKLKRIIQKSESSLENKQKTIGSQLYMFVLENLETKEIIASCGITASMGSEYPVYLMTLKNIKLSQWAPKEKLLHEIKLRKIHQGPSLLISMFIAPSYRKLGLGRLVSLSRFLFIHSHPHLFKQDIAAELRGFHQQEQSPFFEEILKPFFPMSYNNANQSLLNDSECIKAFFPKGLIFEHLPLHIQASLGKPHPATIGAQKVLLAEGFKKTGQFCLLDGGPFIKAKRSQILSYQEIKSLANPKKLVENAYQQRILLASGHLKNFRALFLTPSSKTDSTFSTQPIFKEILNQANPKYLCVNTKKSFNTVFSTHQNQNIANRLHAS